MRVLVCGGRGYGRIPNGCPDPERARYERQAALERWHLRETLDCFDRDNRITVVIHGAAPGTDYLAARWAKSYGIQDLPFPVTPAEWRTLRKAAGPIRNQRMIDEGRPDLVVAFPGGRGTADMVRRAERAGLRIIKVDRK